MVYVLLFSVAYHKKGDEHWEAFHIIISGGFSVASNISLSVRLAKRCLSFLSTQGYNQQQHLSFRTCLVRSSVLRRPMKMTHCWLSSANIHDDHRAIQDTLNAVPTLRVKLSS